MKTYLSIIFSSEGGKPSEVKSRLLELGLKAVKGSYDFVYEWDREPDIDTLLWFADRIQSALKGMDVMFSIETV
ncbi:MAG: hypothetical protein FE041_04925 [Thermoplasmata archaeon]|nr:MAG: hypothetical protein FE041_04925 [Thermoplasmata archaeon]